VRVAANGRIDRVVEMPVNNITACTFSGPNLRALYVTTAAAEAARSDRLAAGLYVLEAEIPGQPENRFCAFG
jgi:sugar lactone lactonase YvrE